VWAGGYFTLLINAVIIIIIIIITAIANDAFIQKIRVTLTPPEDTIIYDGGCTGCHRPMVMLSLCSGLPLPLAML